MKYLTALLPVLLLSACDPFGLPENPPDTAAYYVSATPGGSAISSVVAIAYETPDGLVRDTLRSPSAGTAPSWSRVFDRDALPAFSISAENLAGAFVSVSLLINQETVAFDSSSTKVELSY